MAVSANTTWADALVTWAAATFAWLGVTRLTPWRDAAITWADAKFTWGATVVPTEPETATTRAVPMFRRRRVMPGRAI
jgi:hypothetical protein